MRNTTCLSSRSRMSKRFVSVNSLSILLLLTVNHSALLVASTKPAAQSRSAKLDEARRLADEAMRLRQRGSYDEAIPLVERWLAIVEKVSGSADPNVAIALNNLAGLYQDKGDYAKAEPLFQRALAIMEKARGPKHPDVATDLNNLAVLYFYKGDYTKAEPLYQRALAIVEKALGPEDPLVAAALNNLHRVEGRTGPKRSVAPGATQDAFGRKSQASLLLGELHSIGRMGQPRRETLGT